MIKTSVYLPDDLGRALKDVAKQRGLTESELIRAAVCHELALGGGGARSDGTKPRQ